jgi:protein-L-isoaspartate(D-aspartate) O-methyltransferase
MNVLQHDPLVWDAVQGCQGLARACLTLIPLLLLACGASSKPDGPRTDPTRQAERDKMVDDQIVMRGITDPAVIAALRRVPRHEFVPDTYAGIAYDDGPVPIGYGQTISQPAVVAFMTEALRLKGKERVLEVGTGSGYQAAVLAEIVSTVFTIEINEPLAKRASITLAKLGYNSVNVRVGDGYRGWPEKAPFDAIIVTAAPDHIPQPLLEQLAPGGRLILPVGKAFQRLVLFRRTETGYERTELLPVLFVPMTGESEHGAPQSGGR